MNSVRKQQLFLLGALSLFCFVTARPQAATEVISRNLKLGDSGTDVVLLQKILNRDPDTRVAPSGPGSPGQETIYFGPATRKAVSAFQKKYIQETLMPVGLTLPTGFVGIFTRNKLNAVASVSMPVFLYQSTSSYTANRSVSSSDIGQIVATTTSSSSSPNLENIDLYLAKVADLERAKGIDEATIEQRADYIRQYAAATSTDFKKQFDEIIKKHLSPFPTSTTPQGNSLLRGDLFAALGNFFRPLTDLFVEPAHAFVGVPFGGPILWTMPCICTGGDIWQVYVGPPSVGSDLDYSIGTQAFASYNLPFARFLLGFFNPGVNESCVQYFGLTCAPLPSEGLIMPMVGSSPL